MLAFKNEIPLVTREVLLNKGAWLQEVMGVSMGGYGEMVLGEDQWVNYGVMILNNE